MPLNFIRSQYKLHLHKTIFGLWVFLEEGVEFLVVGGYAVAAHGLLRATKAIDLWVGCSPAKASRVITALKRFGAAVSEISEKDFLQPGITFQIGIPPRRIDIITEIEGVQFQNFYDNAVTVCHEHSKRPKGWGGAQLFN